VTVVSDTSVLLNLCLIGQQEILRIFFKQVWVPVEVKTEFDQLVKSDARFHKLIWPIWAEVHNPVQTNLPGLSGWHLGPGERHALALALEHHATILIDEKLGRLAARKLGLQPIGVVGLLVQAKSKGIIPSLKPIFNRLKKEAGFWVSAEVELQALREVGES
jgi:predicted nucleic acid-binding protein